ncbi:hypothetical protein PMAYCL1PPCAC_07168, partial [Pristionchus mayeri]
MMSLFAILFLFLSLLLSNAIVSSLLPSFLFPPSHQIPPSCSLEWCGEREVRLPSNLLIDACKLAEEVYKVEVLNKKLDYLQAACLDVGSGGKSCWTGSSCSCSECSSLIECCIASQKCTSRILRSQIGISFQRSLSLLNGAITKCRLNTQKALMTGMTKDDADVGVLILEEIRLFNQYSPRAVLGNRTKSLLSERIRKDLRPVILGDTNKGEGKPLIVFSRKGRDLLRLLEMVEGKPMSKQKEINSIVDGETGKESTWIYRKGNEEGKSEQVYPSLSPPILSPRSIPDSTTTVSSMEPATTVFPTTVVIAPTSVETTTKSGEWHSSIPIGVPNASSTLPDSSLFTANSSKVRRKERLFDHLKGKMKKRVTFYDLRKVGRRGEVRRSPPRRGLTKEDKEILKSIDVK